MANKALAVEELLDVEIEPPTPRISPALMGVSWLSVILGAGWGLTRGGGKT